MRPGYRYQEHWPAIGERFAAGDPLGAVCWPGAPDWFNRFFAQQQARTIERAVRSTYGDGRIAARALDLGAGTGRWTGWLEARGADAVGVELSSAMLAAAGSGHYVQGDVTSLPFRDRSFDLALSVTVLLHLPPGSQEGALREAGRVLRPRGRLIVLEMVNPVAPGPHVFPRSVAGWLSLIRRSGFDPRYVRGEAQAPLLRLGFALGRRLPLGRNGRPAEGADIARLRGPARLAARAAVRLSYPIERAVGPIAPAGTALNVCVVATRRG